MYVRHLLALLFAVLLPIVRYTRKTWCVAQARAYSEKLRTGLQRLARGQGAYKAFG